jgi:hypothetical protein
VTRNSSQKLAAILHETLRRVELSSDISPDDRALQELKRVLLLKIAALEAEAAYSGTPVEDASHPLRAA